MASATFTDSDFEALFDLEKFNPDEQILCDFDTSTYDNQSLFIPENSSSDEQVLPNPANPDPLSKDSENDPMISGELLSDCTDPDLVNMSSMQSSSKTTTTSPVPSLLRVGGSPPVINSPYEPLGHPLRDLRDLDSGYHYIFDCRTATPEFHTPRAWAYYPVGIPHPSLPPGYLLRGHYTVSEDQSDCPPGHVMVEGHLSKRDNPRVLRQREVYRQHSAEYRKRKKVERSTEEGRPTSYR